MCTDTPKFDFFQFEHKSHWMYLMGMFIAKKVTLLSNTAFRRHKNVNLLKAIVAIIQPTANLFKVNSKII